MMIARYRTALPLHRARGFALSDIDAPGAAFRTALLSKAGRGRLHATLGARADSARRRGLGLILSLPGGDLAIQGHPAPLRRAVALMGDIRQGHETASTPIVLSGLLAPRATGAAADLHRPIRGLARSGVDMVIATCASTSDAVATVHAAAAFDLPIAIRFTTTAQGDLPGGGTLADAIAAVDDKAAGATGATNATPVFYLADMTGAPTPHPRLRRLRADAHDQGDFGRLTRIEGGFGGPLSAASPRLSQAA
ncbi:MAG: hypothetical protein AAGE76_07725 [Pseudomonadota bacterium]